MICNILNLTCKGYWKVDHVFSILASTGLGVKLTRLVSTFSNISHLIWQYNGNFFLNEEALIILLDTPIFLGLPLNTVPTSLVYNNSIKAISLTNGDNYVFH